MISYGQFKIEKPHKHTSVHTHMHTHAHTHAHTESGNVTSLYINEYLPFVYLFYSAYHKNQGVRQQTNAHL